MVNALSSTGRPESDKGYAAKLRWRSMEKIMKKYTDPRTLHDLWIMTLIFFLHCALCMYHSSYAEAPSIDKLTTDEVSYSDFLMHRVYSLAGPFLTCPVS
ncbi:hypothetical protein TNCV_4058981 [Trichonephila clavipes]|nr:hypothetical protein TNCV_4058981 [Trichonephila clavipes]